MKKVIVFAVCLIFSLGYLNEGLFADETMNRIERTGKLRVGWRETSVPFAYMDKSKGNYVGFSVDMTYLLADKLSEHFGKKIEIEPYSVSTKTRISMVEKNDIDIEMGSTTHTQKRDEVVDFSLIFFFSETTFLVKSNSKIKRITDLDGRRVASAKGSSNLSALKKKITDGAFSPKGNVVEAETHADGFALLEGGFIDAYCTDRSILEGIRMKADQPENYRTVEFAIAYEPYGYMVSENNSDIRDFIDNTILWAIKTGKYFEIYDKWMGPNGVVTIPMSKAFRSYLELISYPMKPDWWKKKS